MGFRIRRKEPIVCYAQWLPYNYVVLPNNRGWVDKDIRNPYHFSPRQIINMIKWVEKTGDHRYYHSMMSMDASKYMISRMGM